MTPLDLASIGEAARLPVALLVGVAFGWCLERGGMGDARKLAGQFYLRDLAVFKVLFTAVVTAMVGVFWLGRLGVLEPGLLEVPGTWVPAQVVGGLVFGIGFVVSGLCPGTSCVALASGRLDGLAVAAGMAGGVVLFAELQPFFATFHGLGGGVSTLPAVSGLPVGGVVAAITGAALLAFAAVEWLEAAGRIGGGSAPGEGA